MIRRMTLLAALWLAGALPAQAQAVPDMALGKRTWMQCRACHAIKADEPAKTTGPSLHGVFGAKAGAKPGFNYSPAMKASGIVWNDKTMDALITSPTKTVRGTRMSFAGIPDPAKRAALIAYIKAESK